MNRHILWIGLLVGITYTTAHGQTPFPIAEQATSYEVTGFGAAATGDRTPFWQVSKRKCRSKAEMATSLVRSITNKHGPTDGAGERAWR